MKIEIATGAAKQNLLFVLVTVSDTSPLTVLWHFPTSRLDFQRALVTPGTTGGHVSLHWDCLGTSTDRGTREMWGSYSSYTTLFPHAWREAWCSPVLISKSYQGADGRFCTKMCRNKSPVLHMSSRKKMLPILNNFYDCL